MPTATSPGKCSPLAIVIVLHLLAAAWCVWPIGLVSEFDKQIPPMTLFPLAITYLAVWLAVQPQLWQRMPWALVVLALLTAWCEWAIPTVLNDARLPFLFLGGLLQLIIVRRHAGLDRASWKWRLGVRHFLLWTAAVALAVVLMRRPLGELLHNMSRVNSTQTDLITLAAIMMAEYTALTTLLILMILRRKFWPWIVPFVMLLLPAAALLDASIISLAFDYQWFLDWEGMFYLGLQMLVLALTSLAWRHSGLLSKGAGSFTA